MWPSLLVLSGFAFSGMLFMSLLLEIVASAQIPGLLLDAFRRRSSLYGE
jgi:hypothetical protein